MNDPQIRDERRRSPLPYFVYTGWIVGVLLAVTLIVRIQLGDLGWSFTKQLLAVGVTTLVFVAIALWRANSVVLRDLWNRRAKSAGNAQGKKRLAWPSLRFGVLGTIADEKRVFGGEWSPARTADRVSASLARIFDFRLEFFTRFGEGEDAKTFRVRSASLRAIPRTIVAIGQAPWLRACLSPAAVIVYVAAALGLLLLGHRVFVVIFALVQVYALQVLLPSPTRPMRLWLALLTFVTWALASGMTYTHLGDWLLNGDSSTGLAMVAFVLAFGLVTVELSRGASAKSDAGLTRIAFGIGLALFVAYALRTDNMLIDWVPYHRSDFADIAQFVKDGHWLLWDVPSLYGFLSILTLAVIPARNGWQALYELTAFFLVAQACITFAILRWGRSGWINAAFAVLFPLATLFGDSLARYAWSARLYPQGGMRFIWIVCLLFVAFLLYVWREHERRVVWLRWCGFAVWAIALFWSFENAIWATMVWVPFVLLDALITSSVRVAFRPIARIFLQRGWPFVVLPVLGLGGLDLVYHLNFGSAPDWRAFVEFLGLFASGGVRTVFHVQYLGAGWIMLLVLGAIGTVALAAIFERRWRLLPLLAAAWLAVWITSSYFAVEPLDMYVTLLLAVLAPGVAIAIFASRELEGNVAAMFARISIVPVAVIAIAFSLGEPPRLAAMQLPFTRGWSPDVTQTFAPLSGELARLMRRANIGPDDLVVFPNGDFWTELTQGIILPFTRLPNGKIVMYHSWLPVSPVGPEMLMNGMPASRRSVYIERYLDLGGKAGWYITYRKPAQCEALSARLSTVRSYSSTNFSASLCALDQRFFRSIIRGNTATHAVHGAP